MNTTILLSTQRSGTTFFDAKINGMCGMDGQGGELISPRFYLRHNVEHLIQMDRSKFNKHKHFKPRFNPKKTPNYVKGYVDITTEFLKTINKHSPYAMYNVMYNALKNDVEKIKNITSPVIHLIRRDLWAKAISGYVTDMTNTAHVKDDKQSTIDVTIDKQRLIKFCERLYPIVNQFDQAMRKQSNVMTLYYEDVTKKETWTSKFISNLENFMKVKFTDVKFNPPYKKTRDYVNIVNKDDIMDPEMIKKFYIQ